MVFDTMVVAYALIGVAPMREKAAAALSSAREILVPDAFFAELTNVTWQWCRHGSLRLDEGLELLDEAESLVTEAVPCRELWALALDLSLESEHPAYDTLFVALAMQRGTMVATEDRKLLRKFPKLTRRLADL